MRMIWLRSYSITATIGKKAERQMGGGAGRPRARRGLRLGGEGQYGKDQVLYEA